MRADKLHVVRFRGICSVIELSEKKGGKYILASRALRCSHSLGLNQTKTTNRGRCDTDRFCSRRRCRSAVVLPRRDEWLFRIYNVLSIACGDYVEMLSCVSVKPVASNYFVHNPACCLDT